MGYDAGDGVRGDDNGIGFPAHVLKGYFPAPVGQSRSLALLEKYGPGELQLQGNSHLPSGRVDQEEEIQFAISDYEEGVGSGPSQPDVRYVTYFPGLTFLLIPKSFLSCLQAKYLELTTTTRENTKTK